MELGTNFSEERFLVRSWMALSAVIAVACFAAGCSSTSSTGLDIDKSFRPFIPADTEALAGIDLDKLKASPLYQRHEKDLPLPAMEGSAERIGIDPRRDVSDVLIAWNGKRALFFVRGRFKPSDVEQKLVSLGAPRATYKNHPVFGDANNSVAFLSKGFAIEGTNADVQKAIDLDGGSEDTIPEELQERLQRIPKDNQVWIVSRGGLPFADMAMRSDVQSALSNIVNFVNGATVSLKAEIGLRFQVDISCISEQGAQRVHDALRGAIGLGRLATKDDQHELLQMYDAINVDQDKAVVHVHADYSGELATELLEQFGRAPLRR